jgi:hypothetical protein
VNWKRLTAVSSLKASLAFRLVAQPVRFVRDTGRVAAKNAAMKVLGKGGFEAIKQKLAARG